MKNADSVTKILITKKELQVIENTYFFLTKVKVTHKIIEQLLLLRTSLKKIIQKTDFKFPSETDILTGKISKGENYLSYPYIILDYPKLFKKNSIFAFRSMFWWGNFYSFTFHVSGNALKHYRSNLISNISKFKKKNYFFCINENQWQHEFSANNYKLIDNIPNTELTKLINTRQFIKISKKISLHKWKDVIKTGEKCFTDMLNVCQR